MLNQLVPNRSIQYRTTGTWTSFTTEQAIDMIYNNPEILNSKSTLVYQPEWHKGVIGIVASTAHRNFLPTDHCTYQFECKWFDLWFSPIGERF